MSLPARPTYKWFFAFNLNDFIAADRVSKTYTVILDGIGQKDITAMKGAAYGFVYEGVYIYLSGPLNALPQAFAGALLSGESLEDGVAGYMDEFSNVWLGVATT